MLRSFIHFFKRVGWKKVAKVMAANVLGVVVGVELAVRFVFIPVGVLPPIGLETSWFMQPHREYGLWNLPYARGQSVGPGWKAEISFNSVGMRGHREFSVAKPQGVWRVVVIGDSMAQAYQVDDDKVFSERLNRQLGPKVEILNFSVLSTGLAQHIELYTKLARDYEPDLIIYLITTNDISDSFDRFQGAGVNSHWHQLTYNYTDDGRLVRVAPDMARFTRFESSWKRSPWIQKCKRTGWFVLYEQVRKLSRAAGPIQMASGNHSENSQRSERVYALLAEKFADEARDVPVLVVQNLFAFDFIEPVDERYIHIVSTQKQAWMEVGIPYEHPVEEAKAFMRSKGKFHAPYLAWPQDGHYSPLGHEFLTLWLRKAIETKLYNQ